MYSDFVFLDRFLFELSCKNTHTQTRTHTHTHRDSNEYPIVAFSKNATIIIMLPLAVTNNIHGRNEGWFNCPTGSTDHALPY